MSESEVNDFFRTLIRTFFLLLILFCMSYCVYKYALCREKYDKINMNKINVNQDIFNKNIDPTFEI